MPFSTTSHTLLRCLAALFLAGLVGLSFARPMDVYVPHVTHPLSGTVWKVGGRYNVTWDTSNAPKTITNKYGRVVLVVNGALDYEHPLAVGFPILEGHIEIVVPTNTTPGDKYQIVLFGDSGNMSPHFTITL